MRPMPTPLEAAIASLSPGAREEVLDLGRPRNTTGGHAAPLQLQVDYRSSGVTVRVPTPRSWARDVAWHEYCREHGYPTGDLCGAASAPGSKYPPKPRYEGRDVTVGWAKIRDELRRQATGQLTLDDMLVA